MNTYGGVDIYIHVFLTSPLLGSEWSASRPGRFAPRGEVSSIHWIEGWVGPRTDLDGVERRKSYPYRDSNSDPSAVQPVASRYTDCAIPAPISPLLHITTFEGTTISLSTYAMNLIF
jgi:hypothetical protein